MAKDFRILVCAESFSADKPAREAIEQWVEWLDAQSQRLRDALSDPDWSADKTIGEIVPIEGPNTDFDKTTEIV